LFLPDAAANLAGVVEQFFFSEVSSFGCRGQKGAEFLEG